MSNTPEFLLTTDPSEILFASPNLGEESITTTLKITNETDKHFAFKVKCTSNEIFRIRPPVGLLAPKASVDIKLVFSAGKTIPDNHKHYFAVYYITNTTEKVGEKDAKTARQVWAEHNADPEGTRRIYVNFQKGDKDASKKEDEKDDKKDAKADKEEPDKKDAKADKEEPDKKEGDKKKDELVEPKKDTPDEKKETPKEDEKKPEA